jgi:hypothetical protein
LSVFNELFISLLFLSQQMFISFFLSINQKLMFVFILQISAPMGLSPFRLNCAAGLLRSIKLIVIIPQGQVLLSHQAKFFLKKIELNIIKSIGKVLQSYSAHSRRTTCHTRT